MVIYKTVDLHDLYLSLHMVVATDTSGRFGFLATEQCLRARLCVEVVTMRETKKILVRTSLHALALVTTKATSFCMSDTTAAIVVRMYVLNVMTSLRRHMLCIE